MSTLLAFYDLAFGPVSYDFVTWLVRAMRERDRHGCIELHVVIVPKEDGLGGFAREWGKHDAAATRWRLQHIVIGSCQLARATVTVAPTRAIAEDLRDYAIEADDLDVWWPEGKAHFMGPLVLEGRAGTMLARLAATDAARGFVLNWLRDEKRRIVTVTLREQTTDPDRNSNRGEWERVIAELQVRGYRVIVVDDAHLELSSGHGFAALDPDLRLALYERAAMNMITNNGPQELLKFSAAPYLIFGLALSQGWRDHFKKYFHMDAGDQLPWARARDQRLLYRRDDYSTIKEEFERWESATQ